MLLGASAAGLEQHPESVPQNERVMLAAVSRDDTTLVGGLSSSRWTGRGTVYVEPMAWITESGEWRSIPCDYSYRDTCKKFEREYLSKAHTYTVVSADGRGASVQSAPVKLSECADYTGTGTYSGASISGSAIAASSTDMFAEGEAPRLLDKAEAAPIRQALATLVPGKLDPTLHLRLYSLQLEGKNLIVLQWSTADFIDKPQERSVKHIFGIGTLSEGHFQLLRWKQDTEDEDERILGTIRLKSGREFLITTACDPESQRFRVYGIREDKLKMVYEGGGSSC